MPKPKYVVRGRLLRCAICGYAVDSPESKRTHNCRPPAPGLTITTTRSALEKVLREAWLDGHFRGWSSHSRGERWVAAKIDAEATVGHIIGQALDGLEGK